MGKIKTDRLSDRYAVRRLGPEDVDMLLAFCRSNTQFYEYCGKEASEEQIRQDLTVAPPGIPMDRKYYVGFFDGSTPVAVMDLIDGYPDERCAFIGFFMMNSAMQGAGVGSAIVSEVFGELKNIGFDRCRLGIDRDNPQSNHFWKKNGFTVIREVEMDEGVILVAERQL